MRKDTLSMEWLPDLVFIVLICPWLRQHAALNALDYSSVIAMLGCAITHKVMFIGDAVFGINRRIMLVLRLSTLLSITFPATFISVGILDVDTPALVFIRMNFGVALMCMGIVAFGTHFHSMSWRKRVVYCVCTFLYAFVFMQVIIYKSLIAHPVHTQFNLLHFWLSIIVTTLACFTATTSLHFSKDDQTSSMLLHTATVMCLVAHWSSATSSALSNVSSLVV